VSALGILTLVIVNGTHQNAIRKDYLSRFGILKPQFTMNVICFNLFLADYGIRIDTSTDGKNHEVGLGRMERVLQLQRKENLLVSMSATPSQQTTRTDATLSLIAGATKSVTTDTPTSATPMPRKGKWLKMLEISTSPTEPSSAETSPQLPASLNVVLPQPVSPESTEKHEPKTAGTPSETTRNPLKRTLFLDTPTNPKKKKKD
ncbi:hypothetical protein Tco_0004979, partial [Tanacetum coccineum]